jgi:hypothetical protein
MILLLLQMVGKFIVQVLVKIIIWGLPLCLRQRGRTSGSVAVTEFTDDASSLLKFRLLRYHAYVA